jgi:hypothetical protein
MFAVTMAARVAAGAAAPARRRQLFVQPLALLFAPP